MSDLAAEARALLGRLGADAGGQDVGLDQLAALLTQHEAQAGDRETRTQIRRILYRLRQHGVATPTPEATPPPRAVLAPTIEGFVSSVDGRGDRLIWLVREQPSGGLLLVAADLNEPEGLRDLRVFDATRKQLRAMRERFQTDAGLRLVAADWRALDALVVEAQERAGAPESRGRDYRHVRTRLTTEPATAARELVSPRADLSDATEAAALVAASATLLTEPEFRTWWPRPEMVEPLLAEIRGLRDSPIVLSDVQQQERLRELLARATTMLYPALVIARRLEATAYVLAETERARPARCALAVASALRAAPESANTVPFLQALTQQGLGAHLAAHEAEEREERKGSLVLTPTEVATAKSPSRRPRARA